MNNSIPQLEEAIVKNCEGIYQVDHRTNTYTTLKTNRFLVSMIDESGSYTALFKRLISAGDVFMPHSKAFLSFIQQHSFGAVYSRRIRLVSDGEARLMTMIYYPVPDTETAYITLCPLPEKFTLQPLESAKQEALSGNFLLTMLVSLDQDTCFDAYVAEIAFSGQDYQTFRFSDWRNNVKDMVKPENRTLFLSKTEPGYIRHQLATARRYYFDLQMQNMEGRFLWARHSLIQVQNKTEDANLLFVYTIQDIEKESTAFSHRFSIDSMQEDTRHVQDQLPDNPQEKEAHISALSTVILERIKNEIDECYMDKLSLNMMAGKYYMNAAYLGQLFIRKYDLSFHEYLTRRRMEESAALLSGTNYTIRQIIDLVGISNPQYFNRLFRKYYQCSPTEYRRNNRQ